MSSELTPCRWTLDGEGGADRTLEWRRGFDMDVLLAAVLDSIGRRPSIPTTASADLPAGKALWTRARMCYSLQGPQLPALWLCNAALRSCAEEC